MSSTAEKVGVIVDTAEKIERMNLQPYRSFVLLLVAFALLGAAGLLWMTISLP